MAHQKIRRDWKRIRPNNLRAAFRLCKDHAREKGNLSVARIAELMGDVTEEALYKWLSTGRMPATLIPLYEHICGINYVTDYLLAGTGRFSIQIPSGRSTKPIEIADLQVVTNEAIGKLIRFYRGDADAEDTINSLTDLIEGVAYHRSNIEKNTQPELNFVDAER